MNAKEAREIVTQFKDGRFIFDDVHPNAKAYFLAEGFLECHAQASKAAEPLLGVIERQRKILEKIHESYQHDGSGDKCAYCDLFEALSSSAPVVENYRKEVLGE